MVMQYPAKQREMFYEIHTIDEEFDETRGGGGGGTWVFRAPGDERGRKSPGYTFLWLLGKHIENMEVEKMAQIWTIAGQYISSMYNRRLCNREGIG